MKTTKEKPVKWYHVWARKPGTGSFVSTYRKGASAKQVKEEMTKEGYEFDSRVTIAKYPPK